MIKRRGAFFLVLLLFVCTGAFAGSVNAQSDTLVVFFRQGYSLWDPSYMGNGERMQQFVERFKALYSDKVFNKISKIHIEAGCSPEGYWEFNQRLSRNRIASIRNVLKEYVALPDSSVVEHPVGINWDKLRDMVVSDRHIPYKDEVLEKLEAPEVVRNSNGKLVEVRKLRLMYLRNGEPWKYMYKNYFPRLRNFNLLIVIEWKKLEAAKLEVKKEEFDTLPAKRSVYIPLTYQYTLPAREEYPPSRSPFYMAAKSNLLYDALLVPNLGVEFYLGCDLSFGGNWMYAWWNHDAANWYWRIYGCDLSFRKWFGRASEEKPLTGHHFGIYGQMLTYDFETGGRGYMGGQPGGTLWDKANYVVGLEYGYSHPIGRRLNLDFVVGGGYMCGEYHEYIPEDDCYVWQVTKKRRWFGPTKAEVSLVWQLGYGNVNKGKGRKWRDGNE